MAFATWRGTLRGSSFPRRALLVPSGSRSRARRPARPRVVSRATATRQAGEDAKPEEDIAMDAPLSTLSAPPAATRADRRVLTGGRVLAGGVAVVAALAAFKVALHLVTTGWFGYSYFVDELY